MPNINENIVSSIISSSVETAASNVEETISSHYKKTVAAMKDKGLNLIANLPKYDNYRAVTQRRRKKVAKVKTVEYKDLKKVEVPQIFIDFLLGDFNDNKKNRILIFSSSEARELMKVSKTFFADGTFKNCPRPFKQLYVIFCDLGSTEEQNNVVPVMYVLMANKSKKSYSVLFNIIKRQIPEWEPVIFITDFEWAAISAMKNTFPQIAHHGCFFHFQDKLKRKAKRLMIKKNSNKIVSLCMVLPLLPENKIEEGFNYILKESKLIGDNHSLREFLLYIQNYWMPKKHTWCVFGQRHRTNNVCEGWNGQFNKCFKRRPNLVHLLKVLNEDATFNAVNAITSAPAKKRTKNIINRNDYILNVQLELLNGEIDVSLFLEKLRY